MPDELTIEDLEKHSGLSTRTLHYYMSIGLLPGPEKRGVNASYTQEHLNRLDLILILKEMHLPLKQIRTLLDRLTPIEIHHYIDDQEDLLEKIKSNEPTAEGQEKAKNQSSALDYIKSLEEAHTSYRSITEDQTSIYQNSQPILRQSLPQKSAAQEPQTTSQDIWRRIVLADGVELHLRDTSDSHLRYKIDRLLSFARSLFRKQN